MEAVIGILLIFTILIVLFQNPPVPLEFKTTNYKLRAITGLEVLKDLGYLRQHVSDENLTAIYLKMSPYIPNFVTYNITLFNLTTNITKIPTITDEFAVSVGYMVAGDADTYKPKEVVVYIWGFD